MVVETISFPGEGVVKRYRIFGTEELDPRAFRDFMQNLMHLELMHRIDERRAAFQAHQRNAPQPR